MDRWLQEQLRNGFRDFAGLSIQGRIPVSEKLANELLAEALRSVAERQPVPAVPAAPAPDLAEMVKLVRKAEVHLREGVLELEFQVGV